MLQSITIRRVALIDEVTIRFHNGLQVLTGETGAGKSMVVDAVNLILGSRSDRSLIRSGSDKASVEAVFDVPEHPGIRRFMEEQQIDYDGRTIIIYREISASGKNICRVCGVLLPLSLLKTLSPMLMDIHGQNDQLFLINPDMQLRFLDETGDEGHRQLLAQVGSDREAFMETHRTYAQLVRKNEGREARLGALEKEISLLKKARVRPGEYAELQEEKKKLSSDTQHFLALKNAEESLVSGEEHAALSLVRNASALLSRLAESDPDYRELSDRCENLSLELEDLSYEISSRCSAMDMQPDRLERIEKRLELLSRLEFRFGVSPDELPEREAALEKESAELKGLTEKLEETAAEHKRLLQQYRASARKLTESRKKLAARFEQHMMSELTDLGMKETQFHIQFEEGEGGKPKMPQPTGDDQITFLISPNPGEPLRPIAGTASGGELSRLMLAFKSLEAAHTGVDAMVFDEIDTGISGRMAQVVAEKMIAISREHQVICVTHLPQLAAAADYQYLVCKSVIDGRTMTSVTSLPEAERAAEVARMISGADGLSSESVQYASRLLSAAQQLKKG